MKKIYILTLALCILTTFSEAQEKETYYKVTGTNITSIGEKLSESKIVFSKNNKPAALPGGVITSFLINDLIIPLVFDKVSTLFYNPEKYIKENKAALSFINVENQTFIYPFESKNKLIYTKMIYESKSDKSPKKAIEAKFGTHKISDKNKSINILELISYEYNFTSVKLKSKSKKVNLVMEITINYMTDKNELKTLNLDPLKLNGLIPNGKDEVQKPKEKIYLTIQDLKFITSLDIKVTEVNSRKKDMDKWLELYTKHKDKIQSFTIDQLN